jgi:hypothetical protein
LFELTKKDVAFVWNLDYQQAFDALKRALVDAPVVMDRTSVRQGKETWLQPSKEIQDKTRQDRTILED